MGKGKQKLNPYMIFINEQVGIYSMIKLTTKIYTAQQKFASSFMVKSRLESTMQTDYILMRSPIFCSV